MSLSIRSCWSLFKTMYFNVRHNRWALRRLLTGSGISTARQIGVPQLSGEAYMKVVTHLPPPPECAKGLAH